MTENWYSSPLPRRIALAYDAARHDPEHPAVRCAYAALIAETRVQFVYIPIPVVFTANDPYPDAADMHHRVWAERVLYVYTYSDLPADHPLAGEPNLLFRAVHDWFGHILPGNSFLADGEEAAFRAHAAMFSRDALPALATETRGQNCWSNFGPHLSGGATNVDDYRNLPADRPFAPQKATILPPWAWEIPS